MKTATVVTVALMFFGCATTETAAVPVKGPEVSVILLAGLWEGSYKGTESGRTGVIKFDLATGSGYAHGKVIMNASDPAKATEVAIKFVNAEQKGLVRGVVGPYTEPQLKVQVETEFIGARRGDTISGTFTTRALGTADKGQTGSWSVSKK